MRIRVLVVDSDASVRHFLRDLAGQGEGFELVDESSHLAQLEGLSSWHRPDVIFCGVGEPALAVAAARDGDTAGGPITIFVADSQAFAVRAFELGAFDYLMKPLSVDRVERSLDRVRQELQHRQTSVLLAHLLERRRPAEEKPHYPIRFAVKSCGRVVLVSTKDIDWIEAAGNYAKLHRGDDCYLLRETMTDLHARLDPRQFRRIHRSVIVNLDRVRELHASPNGTQTVILHDGTRLTASRGYRGHLEGYLESVGIQGTAE